MGTTGVLIAIVIVGLLAALASARAGSHPGYAIAKTVASLGFVGIAVYAGAANATWSTIALVALSLAVAGDIALAIPGSRMLLVGLGIFVVAYLTLAAAFIARGLGDPFGVIVGIVAAVVAAGSAWGWLSSKLEPRWRTPTAVYLTAIGLMIASGMAAALSSASLLMVGGVALLALSDLAVARERFVTPGFINKVWGLPAYYAGMVLVALSLAG